MPLYFTAVVFYFVSIDKTQEMGYQPNLASRSEVVSISKCPTKISGAPKKFGVQKTSNFGPLFPRLQHSTPHISGMKRRMGKQKC